MKKMSAQEAAKVKPRFRAPTIWQKRGCRCRQRILLCFGLPLLPPSATLLGVAYGTNQDFGVFHILGFILTFISAACITAAVCIALYKKYSSKDPKQVSNVCHLNTPRLRPTSSGSSASTNGVTLIKVIKIQSNSLVTESEIKPRHKKKKKERRKHHRKSRTNLPPVKEEDGRARFEQSMEERDRIGKRLHKRTKSESKTTFEHFLPGAPQPAVPGALTKKHLKMLAILNNQGSQESLQRRKSMSDIGDSASERMSIDFSESPRFSKRFVLIKSKIAS